MNAIRTRSTIESQTTKPGRHRPSKLDIHSPALADEILSGRRPQPAISERISVYLCTRVGKLICRLEQQLPGFAEAVTDRLLLRDRRTITHPSSPPTHPLSSSVALA